MLNALAVFEKKASNSMSWFTESLLLEWIVIFLCARLSVKPIYLPLSHFVLFLHCCLCISPSLILFSCSPFGVFVTPGSLQDMVTKYQKRKNKTWEWKMHPLSLSLWLFLSFFSHHFQPQKRIMQYSLSFQFVLFTITLWGEVILNRWKAVSVVYISDKGYA